MRILVYVYKCLYANRSCNQIKRLMSKPAIAMLTVIRAKDSDTETETGEEKILDWDLSTSVGDDDSEDEETTENLEPYK